MNFDYRIKKMEETLRRNQEEFEDTKKKLEDATVFTAKFLSKCSDAGYDRVSVGKRHESLPNTNAFAFGCEGSVFGHHSKGKDVRIGSWPAIWHICENLSIGYGCGNSHQHQAKTENLIDGVYHFKSGQWERVDKEAK